MAEEGGGEVSEAITLSESKRLIALESTIDAGQKTFVEVGNALAEIRDSKLYRADFDTFEAYCNEKWGWSKQHVYRLIECAPIVESNTRVTSIRQAVELAKVEPSKRIEVMEKAAEHGPITAKSIKEAAQSSRWEQGATSAPQPQEHAEEDEDTDRLWSLKRIWRKASKKEKAEFLKWIKKSGK